MKFTDRLVDTVWIRGYLMEDEEGEHLLVESTQHPERFAVFGTDEVEFLVDDGLAGPCLDMAKDYTEERYPVEERRGL